MVVDDGHPDRIGVGYLYPPFEPQPRSSV
jgi:hypothetical protein